MQVDVGCGTGKVIALLERCGQGRLVGVDLSPHSLQRVRQRSPSTRLLRASALALPLSSRATALVVTEGVIHHTPDAHAAFRECARIVAPGGHLFVGVYNADDRYRFSYQVIGRLFRWIGSSRLGSAVLRVLIIPLWYVYFCYLRAWVTSGSISKLTYGRSINLFYDRYMVPRASFHTTEQLTAWGGECGLEVVASAQRGSMLEVLFRRPEDGKDRMDDHTGS
jgi:ubiquinone/menaquinone biosynthesis C-methylase UbiE